MPKPRLTVEQVNELREDYSSGTMRWADLAQKYDISVQTISKHVSDLKRPNRTAALRLQAAQARLERAETDQRLRDDNSRLRSNNKRLQRRIGELEEQLAILQDKNNHLTVLLKG